MLRYLFFLILAAHVSAQETMIHEVFDPATDTNVEVLALNPAGVLATGTVSLPVNPTDGQRVLVSSSQTITALTVNATHTVLNAPTTLAVGAGFGYIYDLATTTWLRLY